MSRFLLRMFSKGAAVGPDPDALVELATVPAFESGLLEADLRARGIETTSAEAFNIVTKSLTDVRIWVRQADLTAALEVLADRAAHPEG